MRILIDTHIALWMMSGSALLTRSAKHLIARADVVAVSSVSVWEISIKAQLGKIDLDLDKFLSELEAAGCVELPVTWEHARRYRSLPALHRDPFDRMLIAQAVSEPLTLITHDQSLADYSELVVIV